MLSIFDLIQANNPPELTIALAATTHIEPQRNVTPVTEHSRRRNSISGTTVATKTVQYDKCRSLLTRFKVIWKTNSTVELEPIS